MRKRYTVKEFDCFTRNQTVEISSYHSLDEVTFDQLEQFIVNNETIFGQNTEMSQFMTISARRGIGKVIQVKNYVGLLTFKNGLEIEILPKIFSVTEKNENETKQIFLDMLKFLLNLPYRQFNMSSVRTINLNILEVFISMFIKQVQLLVKRGLKQDYKAFTANEKIYKGKLNVSQHITNNLCHRERFYVTYEQLSYNRIENQLIKTTLLYLQKVSISSSNQKNLRILLHSFDEIEPVSDVSFAFSTLVIDRNLKEYAQILAWCKVFLNNQSFTSFSGESIAYALLFPMEKVYETYVAAHLKKKLNHTDHVVSTQNRSFYLFDSPKRFLLKPDVVVRHHDDVIILDTKWKMLVNNHNKNYGISQSDMYQMYAYHQKYKAKCVILVYPWTNDFSTLQKPISYTSNDMVRVYIFFVNLYEIESSVKQLVELMQDLLNEQE